MCRFSKATKNIYVNSSLDSIVFEAEMSKVLFITEYSVHLNVAS